MGFMVQGLNPSRSKRLFSSKHQTVSRTHPASYSVGTRVFFTGVKQPRCGVKHSCPSSAKVKNECSYTSTPLICLHGVDWKNLTSTGVACSGMTYS